MMNNFSVDKGEYESYLETLDKSDLIKRLLEKNKEHSEVYIPVFKAIHRWYDEDSTLLFTYINKKNVLNSGCALQLVETLIDAANQYADFIHVDDIVTSELANKKPRAYSDLLLTRRKIKISCKELNHYTINKLSKYAKDPLSEHAKWLWITETSKDK